VPPLRTSVTFQAFPLADGRGLRLVGELDIGTVSYLRRMLETLSVGADGVTLDLAGLSFMDSSGLHALEAYARTLNGARPLVLENVPGNIRRLFELTGMDRGSQIELRTGADHG
jgi:anti-anti-sigma factor